MTRRAAGEHRAERLDLAPRRQAIVRPSGVETVLGMHRQGARRELHVGDQPGQRQREGHAAEHRLRAQGGGEDLPVADLAEPPPVGHQLDRVGQHERQHGSDGEDEDAKGQAHAKPPV